MLTLYRYASDFLKAYRIELPNQADAARVSDRVVRCHHNDFSRRTTFIPAPGSGFWDVGASDLAELLRGAIYAAAKRRPGKITYLFDGYSSTGEDRCEVPKRSPRVEENTIAAVRCFRTFNAVITVHPNADNGVTVVCVSK